jgi:cob(I)alamin adenosyltransferase
MGSTIYTRTGDAGETSLVDGRRVPKTSPRVEAYGTVDEANSWVGAARAFATDPLLARALEFLQHRLFNCSSNLATPADASATPPRIAAEDVDFLERAIDRFEQTTGPLKNFVVPGGSQAAGLLHVARTVCRRAERRVVALAAAEEVDPLVRKFVNRSSDFLFAAARYANAVEKRGDVSWDKQHERPDLETLFPKS